MKWRKDGASGWNRRMFKNNNWHLHFTHDRLKAIVCHDLIDS